MLFHYLIVDWVGWLTFGFVATAVLTAIMVAAQLGRLTRMDLPTMLGTMVTADLDRARLPGILIHFVNGQLFALFYASAFALMGRSGWLLGGAFGLVHGLLALTLIIPTLPAIHPRMASERTGFEFAALEPPALFAQNYGRRPVAVKQHAAGAQAPAHRSDRRPYAFGPVVLQLRHGDQQQRGVQVLRTVGGGVGVELCAPALLAHFRAQGVALPLPALRALEILPAPAGDSGRPVERHERHQLGRDVLLVLIALLPDPGIGRPPAAGYEVGQRADHAPARAVQFRAQAGQVPGGVDHPSVDVQLVLARGGVGCPDRQAPAIAGHAGDLPLGVAVGAVQRVQDLHPGQREAARDLEPAQEGLRLLGEAGGHEGTRPDPGITWPGMAVVPVELAAQLLGQGGGGRRHGSPRRRVGE